ncbi:MAG: hypothetical protein ACPGYQ_01325 [Candidatus Puniceispirillales bacterium]
MNNFATITIKDIQQINDDIATAIKDADFTTALDLDKTRQQHFGTLSHFEGPFSADQLAMLEDMLDNLKSEIRIIEHAMLDLNARTSKHIKRLEGYR